MNGPKKAIKFLDFLMMMSDSLRNIGKAFNLSIVKGDFPHRFSCEANRNYIGRLPALDAEEDWYGFKQVKDQAELDESRSFWVGQSEKYCICDGDCKCDRPKWDFMVELEAYCWLDVDVLAGACKQYRENALEFSGGNDDFDWSAGSIDPFQYMTQSQIALQLFMQGKQNNNIILTHEKIRYSFQPNQVLWMEKLMEDNPEYKIQHAGNSFKEYFCVSSNTYLDGYCPRTKTAFEYFDCYLDGCEECHKEKIKSKALHPTRNMKWSSVYNSTTSKIRSLMMNENYHHVEIRWSHEDNRYDDMSRYINLNQRVGHVMKQRDYFYGGRTEVFAAFSNPSKFQNVELLHHDICSEYPYVCSWKDLPMGKPEIHFNKGIDKSRLNPNHKDPFFGFARIRVRPNPLDIIGILPERTAEYGDVEKLVYSLIEKEGCWHTELIYLAMQHQYEILEIYEVIHWDESQRSAKLMRGYMEFFLRMKQEAEGWQKLSGGMFGDKEVKDFTDNELDEIMDKIFDNNGGFARPRKGSVNKNPVLRQV